MSKQYFAKLNVMARLLDISTQSIYRLIKDRRLREGVHFGRFNENGSMMFYVPEVIAALKPEKARLYIELTEEDKD
jgi:NOL1/NOP2/fmu family ribosome biogenesis protein